MSGNVLSGLSDFTAKKLNYPRSEIIISILQSSTINGDDLPFLR